VDPVIAAVIYFAQKVSEKVIEGAASKAGETLWVQIKSQLGWAKDPSPSDRAAEIARAMAANPELAKKIANEDLQKINAILEEELALNQRQVRSALEIVGEGNVEPNKVGHKLVEVAETYKALTSATAAQSGDDTRISALKAEAQKAIQDGQLSRAEDRLITIWRLQIKAIKPLAPDASWVALDAAETGAQLGDLAFSRSRYEQAAARFAEAAATVPTAHEADRLRYLCKEAVARGEMYARRYASAPTGSPEFVENCEESIRWFRKAYEQGCLEPDYQFAVAFLYASLKYNARDDSQRSRYHDESQLWIRRAAQVGHAAAQRMTGFAYIGEEDYLQARGWLQKAVDQGDIEAHTGLGLLYATGKGGLTDMVEAERLLSKAAAAGDPKAKENLEILRS
jgi:TPR repeat protein